MIAELYRTHQSNNSPRRIYQLYNDAIKVGITEAYYNLAVYIYETLQSKKTVRLLPLDFNYKTMLENLRAAAEYDPIAQNDLAVMIHKITPDYNQKKLQPVMQLYFKKSADTGFMPAIYNQIIMLASQKCTKDTQRKIKKKLDFLLAQHYQPAIHLLIQLKKNKACFK
jgi:TPR repeat protein